MTRRSASGSWLSFASSILLAGCAEAGSTRIALETPEAMAPHLQEPAEGGPGRGPTAKVERTPDPAAGAEVSLGGMLAFADERSPILAVARSTRSRAEAAQAAAAIVLPANPELSLAVGPRMGLAGTGVDVDISLMQQIQIAGERGARLEAADALGDLTDAEIDDMRWTTHCDVHAAFHRALVEQERERLAARVVTFQKEVLRVVEQQIAAGEAAPLALRLAEAEVAQAEQGLVAAKQAFLASRIRLAQLSGWPVESPPTPTGTLDVSREPPPLDRLLSVARARLPGLRAGVARLREAEARSTLADREAWPRPSVGIQYRREGNPTNEGAYDVVMGVVSVPIPSFQLNQGDRARARADVTVAEAELGASKVLLGGRIAEARSEVVAAADRRRAYGSEILPRLEENLSLLGRSFELGEIDILALSAGRERFLRFQSDALDAEEDYFVALSGLERVVGVDLWHDDHHEENPR